jgi:hypothetical protein
MGGPDQDTTRTRESRPRKALIALAVVLVLVVAGALAWYVLDADDDNPTHRGPGAGSSASAGPNRGSGEGNTSAPPSTAATTATTPSEETTPSPSFDEAVAAVAALRAAVEAIPDSGGSGPPARDQLLKEVDKLDEAIESGDPESLAKAIEGFTRSFEHLTDKDELDADTQDAIASALADVVSAAPDPEND